MNLIRINDLQIQEKQPFFNSIKDFFIWLLDQPDINNSNNYLWLNGDIFHKAHPTPKEYDLMFWFIETCKFKHIYLLTGNHDFALKTGNSLKPFENYDKVMVIEKPIKIELENYKILALPYIYDFALENNTMKSLYENLPEELSCIEYDRILFHFDDQTIDFGNNKNIDINYLKTNFFDGGHIHTNFNDHYQGVPVITRHDEKNHKGTILSIDLETKKETVIEVPCFLDYVDITYPDDIPELDIKYPIYNIHEVPTKNIAENYYREKYKDRELFFRTSYKKKVERQEKEKSENSVSETLTLPEYLDMMLEETAIDEKIIEICRPYIRMN